MGGFLGKLLVKGTIIKWISWLRSDSAFHQETKSFRRPFDNDTLTDKFDNMIYFFFLWLFYKTILGIFRHCQVKGCATYHNQSTGFYSFPEEPEKRKQWSEACKITVPDPKKKFKICWRHFEKSNFCNDIDETEWEEGTDFGFGRLRQGTIPSQNLPEDPG